VRVFDVILKLLVELIQSRLPPIIRSFDSVLLTFEQIANPLFHVIRDREGMMSVTVAHIFFPRVLDPFVLILCAIRPVRVGVVVYPFPPDISV